MTTFLLCANPLYGHVNPMLAIGSDLLARGDRVILLTGSRFRESATDSGLEFRSFGGVADFDERDPATFVPDAHRYRGLKLSQYQVESTFIRPIPDQWKALSATLATESVDAVLIDSLFAGALPLLQQPVADRLPVIAIGIGPLAQLSVDTPPANSRIRMAPGQLARLRNRVLNVAAQRVFFAHAQHLASQLIREAGGRKPQGFVIDFSRLPDRYLQLGPREFEYERRDLSGNVRFVGTLPAYRSAASRTELPGWWDELADGRPVVHVTQGTLDNHDLSMVIRPTIDALEDLDLHVIVSTGRAPIRSVGPLPSNTRVAEFLPYDRLLPLCNVMVTNGGYGGTMNALSAGVPLVVAGAAEDKPEVAARVEYFGVGIDLRTGRPSSAQLRKAIQAVLADPSFREHAADMREAIAGYDPFRAIRREIDAALAERESDDVRTTAPE
ncbi:glycosyl transferase [Microlunatus endophyticus]|uniref:Glycosyl transferase n=1 Tax=Microlunatus endophyticus TaxID=1716077 RepID=A0A917W2X2_9ACTN|nr:nucleotide disphospho-sugar-binding domain-containing protein [Microlunatus endophyticus]GGL61704.1 glycosyl transferase [Microlunatus endophyticus]